MYLTLTCRLLFIGVVVSLYSSCTGTNQEQKDTSPAIPQDQLLIAYNVYAPDSTSEDNYEVYTMRLDGSDVRNITGHPDVAWTYMAHGQTIFFISDRDSCPRCYFLYEMNARGENVSRISTFRLADSWMGIRKDGQELVVKPHRDVDSALYVIDRKGSILQRILPGGLYPIHPAFSPDGRRIAFVGRTKLSKRVLGYREEIYMVNDDGTGLKQLTRYPDADTTAEWFAYRAGPPRWHPTEGFISYQSKQNGKYSLYAVAQNGSRQWKLTDNTQEEGWHAWSSDGRWLAIELFDSSQSQFHIGLMNWQRRELNVLTGTQYKYQQAPVFVETGNLPVTD